MPHTRPHAAPGLELTLGFLPINYDRYERVCLAIGLDPDKVRMGTEDVAAARIDDPFVQGAEVIEMVLEDPAALDLTRFEKPAAEEAVACVLAGFFFECLKHFEEQKHEVRTTLAGVELTPLERVRVEMSRSHARLPRSARPTTRTSATSSA